MKATGIVALSLLGLTAAAPHKHFQHAKRDLVWITETAEVVETVVQTTTVWVDATGPAHEYTPTPTPEPTTTTEETPVYTPEPTTSSSSSVYTPPAPSTTETPTSTSTPPAPTTTETPTSTYTPPAPSTTETPTSTYTPPPATTTETPAPSTSAVVAAETASSGSSSSSGSTFSPSRITYYSPSVGLSSCGEVYSDDSNVVALASGNMNSGLCNKKLTIEVNGKTFGAFVGDTCPGCPSDGSLDITPTLFTKMMGSTDAGVITDAKWWWDE